MSDELRKVRSAVIVNRIMKYVICIGIPIAIMLLGIWAMGDMTGETIVGAVVAALIFARLFVVLWNTFSKNKAYAQYVSLYKKEMIHAALNGNPLYDQMEFDYNCGIKPEIVNRTGLVTANRFFSDCYLSGVYNGVSFFQADIRNVKGTRGGYVLEYDGTMIVIPTTLPNATQTNIYHKDVDCSIIIPGGNITTNNSTFDKIFNVVTNCESKAKELVTSDFTSRLLRIQEQINSKIALTVKDGMMYILLPNKKSLLKPKLFGEYDDTMKMEIIKELSRAKLFIDAFSK